MSNASSSLRELGFRLYFLFLRLTVWNQVHASKVEVIAPVDAFHEVRGDANLVVP